MVGYFFHRAASFELMIGQKYCIVSRSVCFALLYGTFFMYWEAFCHTELFVVVCSVSIRTPIITGTINRPDSIYDRSPRARESPFRCLSTKVKGSWTSP